MDWDDFSKRMKRYALSRGARKEVAEEFPAFAWEALEVREWRATTRQLWTHFVRQDLGAQNSAKDQVGRALRSRKEFEYENLAKKDDVKERSGLSLKTQMIAVLVDQGWTLTDISRAFQLDREKIRDEVQVEMHRPQTYSAKAMARRKKSEALDVFNLMFSDFL